MQLLASFPYGTDPAGALFISFPNARSLVALVAGMNRITKVEP
jgi:hypothetical protein